MVQDKTFQFGFNSFYLHLLAMAIMLCDHLWATIIPANSWLTNFGRLAFPIFAFLLVEGFHHTKNIKKYLLRLLIGAILSEIPFNLMYAGGIIYPFHQNVMFTFLIALGTLALFQKAKAKHPKFYVLFWGPIFLLGFLLSFILFVDYGIHGFLTVMLFYFFRGKALWKKTIQLFGMFLIHWVLFRGMMIDVNILSMSMEIPQQGLAILSLIPIWLYNGEQGYHTKTVQYAFYLFYPIHMLVLSLLAIYVF